MVKGEAFSVLPPKKKPRKNSEKKVTFVEIKERVPKPRQPRTTGHPSQPRTASSAAAGHLEHSPEQDNDFEQPSVNSYGSWDCAAVDLEKAAGVKPQSSNQQQKRSANRNARTESNWQQHREQQVSMYLQTHSSRLQLQRGIIISISAAYVKSLWTGHCPRCGLDAADCDFRDIRTVLIGDHFTVHRVEAPIFGCSRCASAGQSSVFNTNPMAAGCFPSTPVHGVNLSQVPAGQMPMWFSMQLLQMLLSLRLSQQRMGMRKTAEGLLESMMDDLAARVDSSVTTDGYRKALAAAMDEYGLLVLQLQQPISLGLPQETILSVCGACSPGATAFYEQQGLIQVVNGIPVQVTALRGCCGAAAQAAALTSIQCDEVAAAAAAAAAVDPTATAAATDAAAGGAISGPADTLAASGIAGTLRQGCVTAAREAVGSDTAHADGSAAGEREGPSTATAIPAATAAAIPAAAAAAAQHPGEHDGRSTPVASTAATKHDIPSTTVPTPAAAEHDSPRTAVTEPAAATRRHTSTAVASPAAAVAAAEQYDGPSTAANPTLPGVKYGPRLPQQPMKQPLILPSVSGDGLFRTPHIAKAGRSSTQQPAICLHKVDPTFASAWVADPATGCTAASGDPEPCNNFKASPDSVLGRSSKIYDVSGTYCLTCRHGFVLAAVDLPLGESWVFAIMLLHVLMYTHNVWPFAMFYDVNCKFGAHFKNWVVNYSGWPAALQAWALAMAFPLPPFHANMHTADCVSKHSMLLHQGIGRGTGEPPEQLNRYMGPAGTVMQYQAHPKRALWLELLFGLGWNRRRKQADLAPNLMRIACRTAVLIKQIQEEMGTLGTEAVALGCEEQLAEWTASPYGPNLRLPVAGNNTWKPWQAEMAELELQLATLRGEPLVLLPSELISSDIGKRTGVAWREKALTQLYKLHGQQLQGRKLDYRHPIMLLGVAQLSTYKVAVYQQTLLDLCAQLSRVTGLQRDAAADRRHEQRRLQGVEKKLRQNISSGVTRMRSWLDQSLLYLHKLDSSSASALGVCAPALQQLATLREEEILAQLYSQKVPWATSSSSQDRKDNIRHRLSRLALEANAAQFEQRLVQYEIKNYEASSATKVEQLQTAMRGARRQVQLLTASAAQLQQQIQSLVAAKHAGQQQQQQGHADSDTYCLFCEAEEAHAKARKLEAQQLLLQQRLLQTAHLQQQGKRLFGKLHTRSRVEECVQAATAVLHASADAVRSSAEPGDDADALDPADSDSDSDDSEAVDSDDAVWEQQPPSETAAPSMQTADPSNASDASTTDIDGVLCGLVAQAPWSIGEAPWDVPADDYVSYKANLRHYRSAVAAGDCTEVRGHLQAVHLQRLAPSVWLNDEVINHRMLQLNVLNGQLQSQSSDVTKCHFFSSYFMASLLLNQRNKGNVNYDAVSRWGLSKKLARAGQVQASLLDCRLLIAPCNLNNVHWVLVIADLRLKRLIYVDPAGGHRPALLDALAVYVQQEAKSRLPECPAAHWDTSMWQRVCPKNIPQQDDGYSCGVFAAVFAHCCCVGVPLVECGLNNSNVDKAARAQLLKSLLNDPLPPKTHAGNRDDAEQSDDDVLEMW